MSIFAKPTSDGVPFGENTKSSDDRFVVCCPAKPSDPTNAFSVQTVYPIH